MQERTPIRLKADAIRFSRWCPALAGLLAIAAAGGSASQASVFVPQAIASPAAGNSAQPQLSVSKRGVLVSWIERAGDLATLKFAERTASGWTAAQTVASGRDWFVNWADVPSVLRLPSGAIVEIGRAHV